MFERFTDRARRVVVLAQEEARAFGHHHIGTEHLLLGLLREGDGIAGLVLAEYEVDGAAVREFVEREAGSGTGQPGGHIPFTPRAKKILELSLREALQLRHTYIGTEHILLGILREGMGRGAQALAAQGLDLEAVRQQVVAKVGKGARERAREMVFGGGSPITERLQQIQDSLDRIERRLDAMGAPPDDLGNP